MPILHSFLDLAALLLEADNDFLQLCSIRLEIGEQIGALVKVGLQSAHEREKLKKNNAEQQLHS